MAIAQPKRAESLHACNDIDPSLQVYNRIKENYAEPLRLAKDMLAMNVARERT